jgi:hypothetical protein
MKGARDGPVTTESIPDENRRAGARGMLCRRWLGTGWGTESSTQKAIASLTQTRAWGERKLPGAGLREVIENQSFG